MKPAARAAPWVACGCGVALLTLAAEGAAQEAVGGAGYEDHYIAGGQLPPDISLGDYTSSEGGGLARALRLEGVVSTLAEDGPGGHTRVHEDGVLVDAQWDTAAYGTWSALGGLRLGDSALREGASAGERGSFTLHERGMPFDDGWQADAALGDLNAPLVDLLRTQPRFLLAQGPMQGAETEWRGPSGLQLLAGGGEPGLYGGIRVPSFETLGGETGALGAQWSPAPQWSIGGELSAARDVALYYQPLDPTLPALSAPNERISSTTGVLSSAWQEGSSRAQLNLIDGTLAGNRNAFGAWLDFARGGGGVTQSFGAFHIDPHLAWGNQLITSDVQGGYYRIDYQSRRWLADFGIDEVRSVSGAGSSITFVNAAARYQLTRDAGAGAVLNLRRGDGAGAWSLETYLDGVNAHGTARLQADHAQEGDASDSSLTLQQSWNVRAGARLSSSLALERSRGAGAPGAPPDATFARLALYGGGDLTARLSLDGSVQWAHTLTGNAPSVLAADVSVNAQLARHWALLLTYYASRVGAWTPLAVTSPLAPPTAAPQASIGERGVFLTVRYQSAQGAHFVPLGGAPGQGSGRLSGTVFLDANENGRCDAGESGVANVTVVLDGRYSVRTDAKGRFDFPAVASGTHELTVQPDNLPLPWTLSDGGRTVVQVSTRERTEVTIGALRLK